MKYLSSKKVFLIICGWIFVSLGVIGIFVPLMPTTIFLIIAAGFFAKSSEKFYNQLINHPRFGKTIRNYYEKKGMLLKSKIIAILMMTVTITLSAIFITEELFVRLILLAVVIGVAFYIASLKTIKHDITPQEE